jgi:K+-transporting ATPase KdpF subunit
MTALHAVVLAIVIVLFVYLAVALFRPERF